MRVLLPSHTQNPVGRPEQRQEHGRRMRQGEGCVCGILLVKYSRKAPRQRRGSPLHRHRLGPKPLPARCPKPPAAGSTAGRSRTRHGPTSRGDAVANGTDRRTLRDPLCHVLKPCKENCKRRLRSQRERLCPPKHPTPAVYISKKTGNTGFHTCRKRWQLVIQKPF